MLGTILVTLITILGFLSLAGCNTIPITPTVVPTREVPQTVMGFLSLIFTPTGLLTICGSILCLFALLSLALPLLSHKIPNFISFGLLMGSAIGFWVLATIFHTILWVSAIAIPIGLISGILVYRHQLVAWAERRTHSDLNKDGITGH